MTPFYRVNRNAITSMIERASLLAQPDEVFRPLFGGRLPTLPEKIQFVEEAVQRMTSLHQFENNLYHVEICYTAQYIHLDIRRKDEGRCTNWRHMQQIKNELVGTEYEAVQLFPAESRKVDTGNEYHLWVAVDANYRFPFGFHRRWVIENGVQVSIGGVNPSHGVDSASQRALTNAAA